MIPRTCGKWTWYTSPIEHTYIIFKKNVDTVLIQNIGKASIGVWCIDMGNNESLRKETEGECKMLRWMLDAWSYKER